MKKIIQKGNNNYGFKWERFPAFVEYLIDIYGSYCDVIYYNEHDVMDFIQKHPVYAFRDKCFTFAHTNEICIRLSNFLDYVEEKPFADLFEPYKSIYVDYNEEEGTDVGIYQYYMYNIGESAFNVTRDEEGNLKRRCHCRYKYPIIKNRFARTVYPKNIYVPVTNLLNKDVILPQFKTQNEDEISSYLFENGKLPGYIYLRALYYKNDIFYELTNGFEYLIPFLNFNTDNNQVFGVLE